MGYKQARNGKILKIFCLLALICVIASFVIAVITPLATGYEISLYRAYPVYFWFFIILGIASGIFILIHESFSGKPSNLWLIGFFVIVLTNILVLLLPVFRGYAVAERSDTLAHLGLIEDILSTSRIGESNYYPVSHLLAGSTSLISGLDSKLVVGIFPAIFYTLYSFGILLLARVITNSLGQALMVTAFGIVLLHPLYSMSFYPVALSFSIIPLTLFFHRQRTLKSSFAHALLLVILLILLPFFHPNTTFFLMAILLIYGVSVAVFNRLKTGEDYRLEGSLTPALILFVTFFTWFVSFAIFTDSVHRVSLWLRGELNPVLFQIVQYEDTWNRAGLTIYEFLDLFIKNFGHYLIFGILSAVAIVLLLRKLSSKRASLNINEVFFALFFSLFGLFFFALLFIIPSGFYHPLREAMPTFLASAMLSGIVFHEWISGHSSKSAHYRGFDASLEQDNKKTKLTRRRFYFLTSFLLLLLILSALISVFSVYPSPIIRTGNLQASHAEFAAGEWIYNTQGQRVTVTCVGAFMYRVAEAILGFEDARYTGRTFHKAPVNFGYKYYSTAKDGFIGVGYSSDVFVPINNYEWACYEELWPIQGRFEISDFEKLETDPTVNFIYNNGEVDFFHIYCEE